jgi:uncharacterized protein (DUF111 family)
VIFRHTSTIGVRQSARRRFTLARTVLPVEVTGGSVGVKIAYRDGVIVQATPEFDDVVAVAAARSVAPVVVLGEAIIAAGNAGLRAGMPVPRNADRGDSG